MTFGDRTPAEVAGIESGFDGWIGLVGILGGGRGRYMPNTHALKRNEPYSGPLPGRFPATQ